VNHDWFFIAPWLYTQVPTQRSVMAERNAQ